MKIVVLVTLAVTFLLLTGCRSAKREGSNTSANASSSQAMNTEPPAPRAPQWAQLAPNISLAGMVRKGLDESNSTPEKPRYTYHVEVHMKNTGAAAITFDTVLLSFEPGKGEPLRQRVTSHPANSLGTVDERKVLTLSIKNGEEKDWDADTDGYTEELLGRATGEPVVFSIVMSLKGRTISGPFRASLPDLKSLSTPSSSRDAQGNRQQTPGVNLKFQ